MLKAAIGRDVKELREMRLKQQLDELLQQQLFFKNTRL